MAHGSFIWNEFLTNDVERAKAFYEATIGWVFEATPFAHGTYWLAKQDGKPVAGMMDMTDFVPPGVPSHWFSYIEVDDVDACVKLLEAAGGRLCRPLFDVPEVGRIAILNDAVGAGVGWMTPVKMEGNKGE